MGGSNQFASLPLSAAVALCPCLSARLTPCPFVCSLCPVCLSALPPGRATRSPTMTRRRRPALRPCRSSLRAIHPAACSSASATESCPATPCRSSCSSSARSDTNSSNAHWRWRRQRPMLRPIVCTSFPSLTDRSIDHRVIVSVLFPAMQADADVKYVAQRDTGSHWSVAQERAPAERNALGRGCKGHGPKPNFWRRARLHLLASHIRICLRVSAPCILSFRPSLAGPSW